MVLVCHSCGVKQPVDPVAAAVVKFCCSCGAKLGQSQKVSSQNVQDGKGPLIQPVEGEGARASPPLYCTRHPDKKVVGLCQPCQDLVCFACIFTAPRQHEECGEPQNLDDFLTSADPFKDQRTLLCDKKLSQVTFLQKLQTSQHQVKVQGQAEISKLRQMEHDALNILEEKVEVEVSKLKDDRDRQKKKIEDATKEKVKELEQCIEKMIDEFQDKIDDVSANLQNLKDAEQKLFLPFSVQNATEQVGASKEARGLVGKTPDPRLPDTTPPGVTPHHNTALHALAELTVRVTEVKLETEVKAEAKVQPKKGPAVPQSGRGSEAYFKPGVRVARGPDWPWQWNVDRNGPGTVVGPTPGNPGWFEVRWDATGRTNNYSVGVQGKYYLRLLDPPSSQ